jgi:hypothetical protein
VGQINLFCMPELMVAKPAGDAPNGGWILVCLGRSVRHGLWRPFPLALDGLAEGQGFADGDPLRVF